MSIVKNPDLIWDGDTEIGEGGRPLEAPQEWQLAVDRMPGEPAPYIYHRDKGFNVDANHIRANISWSQQVTIPAGEQFVIVHCFSHVTWGDDDFTVGWRVELQTRNQTYKSDDVWLAREKGDQSFAIKLDVPQETRATLRVVYWTKWADTNGALDLNKIDIQPQSWGVPVRDNITMSPSVNAASAPSAPNPPSTNTPAVEVASVGRMSDAPVDDSPTVLVEQVRQENPAMAIAFANLSIAIQDCAKLTQQNTDNATIAQCFRLVAASLNRSADTLENS